MSVISGNFKQVLPLQDKHLQHNAKIGSFGAWDVPLYYTSILDEHETVRKGVGVFDISHMGEFVVEGANAGNFLNRVLCRNILKMKAGSALYMPLIQANGGIVDDIIVYKWNDEKFLIIVNAANIDKDYVFLKGLDLGFTDVSLSNISENMGLLAVQGPKSEALIAECFGQDYAALTYYHFRDFEDGIIARTGYTGEDGFEIMAPKERLPEIWDKLFDKGKPYGLKPIGFGARDTLRLEAGMLLYGQDMDESRNPVEAGLKWTLDLSKESFIGKEAIEKVLKTGSQDKMIAFQVTGKGIARGHVAIQSDGRDIGMVTSGTFSPTLKKSIGLGYSKEKWSAVGTEIDLVVRGQLLKAQVVKKPFYKRNQ